MMSAKANSTNELLAQLIALFEEVTLFLLELRSETATLTLEGVSRLTTACDVVKFAAKLSDSVTHELVLLLEGLVLAAYHAFIVRVSSRKSTSVVQTLVKSTDCVLLCLDFSAIVLHHSVALVLKALVLSLRLHKLTLELLEFFRITTVLTGEGLTKVTSDWLGLAAFKGRSERRL